MIDLRLIRHFEAVFRLGSFSKAAGELHLTHSAITKSIKTLEADWNTPLFHRTTRTVAPTEAGKRLHPMAVDLLGFAENVREQTIRGEPNLNIVSGPAALETVVGPAILSFRQDFPKTKINAQTMPPALAIEELVQRRSHILVYHSDTISGLPHRKLLKITPLTTEPYVIIFRPDHPIAHTSFSLEEIVPFNWAIAGYDQIFASNLSPKIRDILTESGFPHYRLLSQAACIDLAMKSDVVTTVPESIAAPLVASRRLVAVPHPAKLDFSVSAATLKDAEIEPTIGKFINSMKI
ncbi:MAG: LysR family transcriptional regulator [Hellea sp.]